MTGFEPATSCSQSIRATKLRYIPLQVFNIREFFFLFQDPKSEFKKEVLKIYFERKKILGPTGLEPMTYCL
jgi:hypothetical protein